jgi:4-alpha-glucanotransferase
MFVQRASGILAHPTSFPSPYGIGDLGAGAYEFVDWLAQGGQVLWQVLPLGPTSYGDSPYQSFSAFAGNPLLIDPQELCKQGWLDEKALENIPPWDMHSVDYGAVITYKMGLFRTAYEGFAAGPAEKTSDKPAGHKKAFAQFCKKQAPWLNDYALFYAIKTHLIATRRNEFKPAALTAYAAKMEKFLTEDEANDYYYGAAWSSWPAELASRDAKAIKDIAVELAGEIDFVKFLQYEFFRQWGALKAYANKKDIRIIGDIPIFVALDSADVWAAPELYCLDGGWPTAVAGCPPDYFSETGQLWGNPLYNWAEHKKDDFAWWCRRTQGVLELVDLVRIDHFRGFEAYWSVPAGEKTAVKGKWEKGPGNALFNALKKHLGSLPIIAEDLGIITEKVTKLRTDFALPGMKILQFAFDPAAKSLYLPHLFENANTVVYTGTHDNDTTQGWYDNAAAEGERDYLRRYMNVSGADIPWDMIRLAFSTSAVFAVVPVQDVLGLGSEARMNQPGLPHGWWKFRFGAGALTEVQAERLAYLTELYHRGAFAKESLAYAKEIPVNGANGKNGKNGANGKKAT